MSKVCHLSSVHRGLDIRIYRKQCLSLARAGHDVHLVIDATASEATEAAAAGITLHRLVSPGGCGRAWRMLVHAWRTYRIAKALDAQLYHIHDPELIPCGVLLAWQGKQVVIDLHEDLSADIQSKQWIPGPLRHAVGVAARAIEHFGARRCAAVIGATPHIAALFRHSAKRVAVIHNYPMIDELAAPVQGRRARDSVCYVGAINEMRGIRQIVQALDLSSCKLLLAGRFDSAALRGELAACPGWRHVEECGFVDRAGVAAIMARSFCGLVTLRPEPNFMNALPIKLFEYMSAGLPVIASGFPLWRGIIEAADCGLCVDPGKPGEIACAISFLRSNPALAEKLGANGRRAIESTYRWDREAVSLLSLYRELLRDMVEKRRLI
ncbi:glycosyltransferase [Rugamonas sp. FT82W]|uniref:Glycosyltransferase n=1 Tax=Duganella vulcania TaxID=2692166 RepID=A0A845GFS0_9BURK|nr:glycosyltransferase family 4 protein [Duganella vulcania]MYM91687.1 glycosyltransferase [Duganella vulcania]